MSSTNQSDLQKSSQKRSQKFARRIKFIKEQPCPRIHLERIIHLAVTTGENEDHLAEDENHLGEDMPSMGTSTRARGGQ